MLHPLLERQASPSLHWSANSFKVQLKRVRSFPNPPGGFRWPFHFLLRIYSPAPWCPSLNCNYHLHICLLQEATVLDVRDCDFSSFYHHDRAQSLAFTLVEQILPSTADICLNFSYYMKSSSQLSDMHTSLGSQKRDVP